MVSGRLQWVVLNVSLLVRLWVEISCMIANKLPFNGQPPCEAVSWNTGYIFCGNDGAPSASLWGCELKFHHYGIILLSLTSASLWGCELKYHCRIFEPFLCVSASLWGCELKCWPVQGVPHDGHVSLLVRLWVEILYYFALTYKVLSASLWGCELKCTKQYQYKDRRSVSLLVRLWVEIICGAKVILCQVRQPPCEAVSWNFLSPS